MMMTILTVNQIINWFRRRFQRVINQRDHNALNQFLFEDEKLNSRTGLSVADFEQLPVTSYTENLSNILKLDRQSSCPICYEEFITGDKVLTLPGCNHVYNENCIKGWLERSPVCPMCRTNVRTNLFYKQPLRNEGEKQQVFRKKSGEKSQEDLESQRVV